LRTTAKQSNNKINTASLSRSSSGGTNVHVNKSTSYMATEFTLFPRLITELRLEIWRFALPELPPEMLLFPYKKGCWVIEEVGWLVQAVPDPNGETLQARYDTSLIEPYRIPLHLYMVNHEARGVAIKYLRQHNPAIYARFDSSGQVESCGILRPFNNLTDTIFMRAADAEVFGLEPGDRLHAPDMQDRYVTFPRSALRSLAVTPAGLEALKAGPLDAFLTTGGMISILSVVEVAPTSTLTLQDLESGGEFPLVGVGEEEYETNAAVAWSHSRREWKCYGPDHGARVRLWGMVQGLESLGPYPGDDGWDVRRMRI
jgi:hypothetical protein